MPIATNNKLLDGAGLRTYTELLKGKFDSANTNINNLYNEVYGTIPVSTEVPSRIDDLEDAVAGLTTSIDSITTTLGNKKNTQEAKNLAAESGKYISGIQQDAQGVISITTTALPTIPVIPSASSSTPGLVQMASGATTNVVYDQDQIDNLFDGITTTISGLDGTYKALQSAVTITAPAGSYISQIEQNAQGVVNAVTATFPLASSATPGMVTLASGCTTTEVYDTVKVQELIDDVISGDISGSYKPVQIAVSNPTASGTSYSFISTISQNENGVITPTAATLPQASASAEGIVQMATGATTHVVMDATQVQAAIDQAVASFVTASVVGADSQGLPDVASPEENVIYLVPNGSGTNPNYYIEYMWFDGDPEGHWEVVGNTELTIETLSNNEIKSIFNTVFTA